MLKAISNGSTSPLKCLRPWNWSILEVPGSVGKNGRTIWILAFKKQNGPGSKIWICLKICMFVDPGGLSLPNS